VGAGERGVGITFDDGYADNIHEAEPILRRFGVPATVFATTGKTNTTEEFFWDELDRLLLQPGPLPEKLKLSDGAQFELKDCWDYSLEEWCEAKGWNVLEPAEAGSRQKLYLELCGLLHRATVEQRENLLAELRAWAGGGSNGRESHRMMSSAELREIEKGGVVEIGAHTVMHPVLVRENEERQREEIVGSKRSLEEIVGHSIDSFSYPFGTRKDYSAVTIECVMQAGFKSAFSNFEERVSASSDRLQLPRFIVRDWGGQEFEKRLLRWMGEGNV
jgi:peptidoglycan/xylan/chitin deacetylase (PgdA/CDA1 family)